MNSTPSKLPAAAVQASAAASVEGEALGQAAAEVSPATPPPEFGGRKDGTEPTRFGDWEKNGRCIDF
jgi:shikimate dehydrogenase